MTNKKPGPSSDYRELLKGQISAEEYVQKMKRDVNQRLGRSLASPEKHHRGRRAASA